MVSWVRDPLGRFPVRPHYQPAELDDESEAIVGRFLLERHGRVEYPLSTEELGLLVEHHCSDVDHYADLSAEGDDVEGMTVFLPDEAPKVSISAHLANNPRRENRLRTTLAHELAHAYFHRALFAERFLAASMFDRQDRSARMVCKRDTILGAREVDWMEWQAGYVSGAILMPVSVLRRRVADFCAARSLHTAVDPESGEAREMAQVVMEAFQVSRNAARVRLLKLGYLATGRQSPSLFG